MKLIQALITRLIGPVSLVGMLLLLGWFRGMEVSGIVITILSWTRILSAIARIGYDQLIFQYSSEFRRANARLSSRIVTNAMLTSIFLTAVVTTANYLLFQIFGFGQLFDQYNAVLLIFMVFCTTVNFLTASCAQSRGETLFAVIVFPTILYVSITLLILSGYDIMLSLSVSFLLNLIVSLFYLGRKYRFSLRYWSFAYLKRCLIYYPVNLNGLARDWGVNYYIYEIIGPAKVPLFAFGTRLASVTAMPIYALNAYLLPLFAQNHKNEEMGSTQKLSRNVVYLTLLAQLLAVSVLIVLEDHMVAYTLLDKFELRMVFIPLVAAQVLKVLVGPVESILMMTGAALSVAAVNMFMVIVVLIAGVAAAYMYGVPGVAATVAAGTAIQELIFAILLYKIAGYSPAIEAVNGVLRISKIIK